MMAERWATGLSRALLWCCAAACVLVVVVRAHAWDTRYGALGVAALASAAVAAAAAATWFVQRGSPERVRRVALELSAFGAALLIAELALRAYAPEVLVEDPQARAALSASRAAKRLAPDHDPRSRLEVVRALRATGVDAYPGISREWVRHPQVRRALPPGLLPLSHASRVQVVECNEGGRFFVYATDEFGFNNPPGLVARGEVDVAALGESATLGHCVEPEHQLVAAIRRRHPRTANFGMAGTHTLSQLATFREYVEPLRPRVVLWFVNPDYVDARDEAAEPLLRRYLDPRFKQRLLQRQPEVDAIVRRLAIPLEAERERALRRELERASLRRIDRALMLAGLRGRLSLGPQFARQDARVPDTRRFEHALALARDAASAWHGRLIVVLLPAYREVVAGRIPLEVGHERLTRVVARLGIPVVNGAALFLGHEDPSSLFVYGMQNHPNERGYRLLASHVLDTLDGAAPARVAER